MPLDVGPVLPSADGVQHYLSDWRGMRIPGEAQPAPLVDCLVLLLSAVVRNPPHGCFCAVTMEYFNQVFAADIYLAKEKLEATDGSRLPVSFTGVLMRDPKDFESELTNTFAITGRWVVHAGCIAPQEL